MAITLDGSNGVTTPDLTVDTDTLTVDTTNNRVGIGTSSPSSKVHVYGAGQTTAWITDAGNQGAFLRVSDSGGAAGNGGGVIFASSQSDDTGAVGMAAIKGLLTDGSNNTTGNLAFSTRNAITDTNLTERMRINANGTIGIAVAGLGAVQMAMQINGQAWFAVWEDDAGNDKFLVASSGNVLNANNSYGGTSDIKLKENIVDASDKLEDLKKVQIRNYNFIGDSQKQIGVIAQELEAVFPGMVENHPDLDEDGNDLGTVTKSVKYSVFVPILIKSLQEQQVIIEDLQTRIQALEAGNGS